ncbi:MAG: phytanoyl-CoA dioxygenase family protein [Betaproteobacteria bacterium]
MLGKREVEQYREEGVVVVPDVMNEPTRLRMHQVLADLIEGSRGVSEHTSVYDLEPGHTRDEPRVRRIKTPHLVDSVFREFMRSPKLVGILQALLGQSVRLHGSKLNLKAAHFGSPVEWHQDWAFYPHTNDDLLAVGVMLDDTTVANGAMYVLPGTHKGQIHSHHGADGLFCGAIDPETSELDFSRAIACEGAAGTCSFHHVRLVHGSAQNTSDRSRALLLYEAGAADAFPLLGVANYDDFRGRMLCGDDTIVPRVRDAPIRMPFPPAKNQGSIYENQTAGSRRYFGFVDTPAKKSATT